MREVTPVHSSRGMAMRNCEGGRRKQKSCTQEKHVEYRLKLTLYF